MRVLCYIDSHRVQRNVCEYNCSYLFEGGNFIEIWLLIGYIHVFVPIYMYFCYWLIWEKVQGTLIIHVLHVGYKSVSYLQCTCMQPICRCSIVHLMYMYMYST